MSETDGLWCMCPPTRCSGNVPSHSCRWKAMNYTPAVPKPDYHAIIRCAYRVSNCIRGIIYSDKKRRFRDGETITTSPIAEELSHDKYGSVIRTKNSVYRVEWREPSDMAS